MNHTQRPGGAASPRENLALPARGRGAPHPCRAVGAGLELPQVAVLEQHELSLWTESRMKHRRESSSGQSARTAGGFSPCAGQMPPCWVVLSPQSSLSPRTGRLHPGIPRARAVCGTPAHRAALCLGTFVPLLNLLRDLSIKECIHMQEPR